ncbi:MAG: RNA methyltransferase [Planctomycetota bacterium]|nr:RNA methyltransferase [Planctomycetota bacterium]
MPKRDDSPFDLAHHLNFLKSLRRFDVRERTGCYWIEGVRHFLQACQAGRQWESVIYSPILLKSVPAQIVIRQLNRSGVRCVRVTPEAFRSVSTTPRASGIGAVVRQQWIPFNESHRHGGIGWIVIEQIRSPGNLGTIIRSAHATGATGIIFIGPDCDPFDPAVVRASMGGLLHVPMVRVSPNDLRHWLDTNGIHLIGLAPDGLNVWTEFDPPTSIAIALGEERSGLSPLLRSYCETTVRLPMCPGADSLNVGVAAGVMLYELVRRAS